MDDIAHIFEAVTLLVVCWITLFVVHSVSGSEHRLERYYSDDAPALAVLNISTTLIVVCFGLNARYLVGRAMANNKWFK